RIGVSTCKGLSHGSGIPCVAVDALETMAAGIPHSGAVICPIQDARAGQVYGAAFHASLTGRPVRLMPDTPLKLEDYLETVRPFGDRFLFLGDGMPVHRERIAELLGEKALFAPPQLSFIRPSAAARIAEDSEETLDYLSLQPMYLRSPSAERNRKLMEAQACRQST
ncbi:MAG: tRNA (adenosine(37)-N6)-threonylcarbamoyltransferase complex dimerization subunit type 1 TsaB, partial [Clostridia bacterium]|nr:tRNA (adenosine(37)-N6)-threonylcarbamoyltransferase complex dimerization subunit type 1 TsaB [Clostridia bacterium]